MYARFILILCLALSVSLGSSLAWADDDAMMDVDNPDYVSAVGTWNQSSYLPCAVGGEYYYAWGGTATITLDTLQYADITGSFAVYARWSAHSNRNNNVRYQIYDGTTLRSTRYQDQRTRGCVWVYLSTVTLTTGKKGRVVISCNGGSAGEVTVADGIRFVRVSKDRYDLVDEAGLEYAASGYRNITNITTNTSALTNLTSRSINCPASGYVFVTVAGIAELTATDRWVRVGIDDTSGGSVFEGLAPVLENIAEERLAGSYEDERRWSLTKVFSVSAGTRTFYLKAVKEAGATGALHWDQMVLIYFPTRY